MLLEKEREEKFAVIRGKEKVERDLNSYSHALKDKESRIAVLSARVKQLERDHFDDSARMKKEAEDYRQQFILRVGSAGSCRRGWMRSRRQ